MVMAMRFKRTSDCIVLLLGFLMSVVDLRIELSATRLSAGYEPPALDYHFFSRVCRNRTALDRPKRPVPAITLHAR